MRPFGPRPPRPLRAVALATLAASVVLAWGSVPALAQQAEGWNQLGAGAAHTWVGTGPAAPYRHAWHLGVEPGGATGNQGLSQPIVVGSTVIAVAPDEVLGIEAATGDVAWTLRRADGPSTPPAVADGGEAGILLFTEGWAGHPPEPAGAPAGATGASPTPSPSPTPSSTTDEVDARLVGVDLATMEPAWEPVMLGDVSRSGVTVDGDTAFVGDRTGTLHAVDVATGQMRWTAEVGGPIDMSPAAGEGLVLVATRATPNRASAVVALDTVSGEQTWRTEPSSQGPSAITIAGGAAIVTGFDLPLESIDLTSGVSRWQRRSPIGGSVQLTGSVDAGVAAANETFVVTQREGLVAAVDEGGVPRWDFAINEPIARGAPAIAGDAVLVATEDGALQAFDLATGERIWRGQEGSGPARGVAVGDEVVVVLRAGASAGLDGWTTDGSGSLERTSSPTVLDPGPALLALAGALVPLAALSFVLARTVGDRVRPDLDEGGDEPVDPLEPDR